MTSYIHTLLAFPFIQQFFCSSMMPTFNFLAEIGHYGQSSKGPKSIEISEREIAKIEDKS